MEDDAATATPIAALENTVGADRTIGATGTGLLTVVGGKAGEVE